MHDEPTDWKKVLGQGIVALFRKPVSQEDGRLASQRIFLPELNSPFFCTRRGGRVIGCCKLLGVRILYFCSCPYRSGHNVPINLQQDNCYFQFCNFLLPYEWKSFTVFKVESGRQSLENGLSCTFQAPGNILLQWCGANMTEHRQQSTKVALKGIDPAQRQPCFLC